MDNSTNYEVIKASNEAAMAKLQEREEFKSKDAMSILETVGDIDRTYRLHLKVGMTIEVLDPVLLRPDEFKVNGEVRFAFSVAAKVNGSNVLINVPTATFRQAPQGEYKALWLNFRELADGKQAQPLTELTAKLFSCKNDRERIDLIKGLKVACVRLEKAKSQKWDRNKNSYMECEVEVPVWDFVQ